MICQLACQQQGLRGRAVSDRPDRSYAVGLMDCAFARFSCRLRAVPFLLVSLILAAPGCSSSQHARSEDITAAVTSGRSADFHGFPARHLMVAEPNEPSTVTNGTTRTSSGSSSEMSVQVDWHWDWMHVGALVAASVNFFAAAATGQGGAALLIPIFTSMLRMCEYLTTTSFCSILFQTVSLCSICLQHACKFGSLATDQCQQSFTVPRWRHCTLSSICLAFCCSSMQNCAAVLCWLLHLGCTGPATTTSHSAYE